MAEQWGAQAAQGPGEQGQEGQEKAPEQEPNFGLSGALAKEANTLRGVELVHTEPPEARKPNLRWRLYIFKNGAALGSLTQVLTWDQRTVLHQPSDNRRTPGVIPDSMQLPAWQAMMAGLDEVDGR